MAVKFVHFFVKHKYFLQYMDGSKKVEYREKGKKNNWEKQTLNADVAVIHDGYTSKTIVFAVLERIEKKTIIETHMGIRLDEPLHNPFPLLITRTKPGEEMRQFLAPSLLYYDDKKEWLAAFTDEIVGRRVVAR